MRTLILFALVLAAGCGKGTPTGNNPTPAQAPRGADTGEADRLKGTWRVVAIEAVGQKVPDDRVKRIQLDYVFEGTNVTIKRPDRPAETGSLALDPSATPGQITIRKNGVPVPIKGIYVIAGNTLRLCLMVDDNPNAGFPTALQSTATPKTDLLTLERQ